MREGFFGIQGLPIRRILQRQPRPGRENADENQNADEILGPHGTNCQMFAKTDHGEITKCCAKKFTKNELSAIACTHKHIFTTCSIMFHLCGAFKIVLNHVPVLVLLQSSKPHVFPACANSLLVVGSRTARRCAKAVKEKHFMSRTSAFRNSQTSRTNLQLLLF